MSRRGRCKKCCLTCRRRRGRGDTIDITIKLTLASKADLMAMQSLVTAHHYLHRPVDIRCSVEAYHVMLSVDTQHLRHEQPIGLLMFGRPEATRCGSWYGSVDDARCGKCEVTRWQVLNLARVWLSPDVQPGGYLYKSDLLPGYVDRHGAWRSTVASTAIRMAVRRIGYDYLCRRPPCFMDEPYEIQYLMSYCDSRIHRGIIYQQSGFGLYRTNDNGIETWRVRLPGLTAEQIEVIAAESESSERSRRYRNQRLLTIMQPPLFAITEPTP